MLLPVLSLFQAGQEKGYYVIAGCCNFTTNIPKQPSIRIITVEKMYNSWLLSKSNRTEEQQQVFLKQTKKICS